MLDGSDFGDNVLAALPDVIGQTVGGLVASAVQSRNSRFTGVELDELLPNDAAHDFTAGFGIQTDPGYQGLSAGSVVASATADALAANYYTAHDPSVARLLAQHPWRNAGQASATGISATDEIRPSFGAYAASTTTGADVIGWLVDNRGKDFDSYANRFLFNQDPSDPRLGHEYGSAIIAQSVDTGDYFRVAAMVLPHLERAAEHGSAATQEATRVVRAYVDRGRGVMNAADADLVTSLGSGLLEVGKVASPEIAMGELTYRAITGSSLHWSDSITLLPVAGTLGREAVSGFRGIAAERAVPRGWSVGDNIYTLTRSGNEPAWSTVRGRFWKNEAANPQVGTWNVDNPDRMSQGLAPQR